jgi:hypothetical protein
MPWPSCHSTNSKRRKPYGSTTASSRLSSHNCLRSTTKLPYTTPSVAFGLASYTVTASETHPKTSKSSISCLRSTPDPKSSISARSSLIESPRTLRSPAEPGQGLRSQTPDGTTAVSRRCITYPTSTPPARPLAVKIIPLRAAAMARVAGAGDGRSNRTDITACFMAKTARIQQGIARKLRPPGTECLGLNRPTTRGLSRTHINTTTHNHTTTATPNIHPTTHTSTTRRYKSYHHRTHLRIIRTQTTKITPKHQSRKTSLISCIAKSFT